MPLYDGKCIAAAISKGKFKMVCYGSYQPNIEFLKGTSALVIKCIDMDRYSRGPLPKTSHMENSYRS